MFGLDCISYAIPSVIYALRAVLDLQLLAPARKKDTNHQVNSVKRVANVTTRGEKNFAFTHVI
jgi:hypothetical protein